MFFKKRITRETSVMQIIIDMPEARQLMIIYGIKFFGNGFTPLDSLETVARGSGLKGYEIDRLVEELNDYKRVVMAS